MMTELIATLLVIVMIAAIGYLGLSVAAAIQDHIESRQAEPMDGRFRATYKQKIGGMNELIVVCDTETNSEYLFFYGYKAGGLTPLGTSCQD